MPEQPDLDLRALATYQRRLVACAMEVVGRALLAVSVVMLLLAVFGVWWDASSARAALIVLSAGGFVVGATLALAADSLPRVPGTDTVRNNAPVGGNVGDPASA